MIHFAEAHYYFRVGFNPHKTLTLISLFSMPDEHLHEYSGGVLTVCDYHGDESLAVIEIESIIAVVGMVLFGEQDNGEAPSYFLAEKLGLDVYDSEIVGSGDTD